MFTQSIRSERGFTLIELLVVILIIGILAAIAIPNFIGQRTRAQDAAAKVASRDAMGLVEACYTHTENYSACLTDASLGNRTGIPMGTGLGQVEIVADGVDGFRIKAHSESGNSFTIAKNPGNWAVTRPCAVDPGKPRGGCPDTNVW